MLSRKHSLFKMRREIGIMRPKHDWYCMDCKEFVDVGLTSISVVGVTAQKACKRCGSQSLMKLGEMCPDDFERLAARFKEETDRA